MSACTFFHCEIVTPSGDFFDPTFLYATEILIFLMDGSRVGWVLVGVVCLTAIASGPLVPGVDLTSSEPVSANSQSDGALGSGSASVSVQEFPDRAHFTEGEFDSGAYYLSSPPIRVTAESITGRPILVCQLDIPTLGYSTNRLAFLNESANGTHVFQFDAGPISADKFDATEYSGELSVFVRANGEKNVIASRNVTVVVDS
jgi:hypothetical protein